MCYKGNNISRFNSKSTGRDFYFTIPLYGTESLKRDMSVKGELFRTLLPLLESENEEQRLVAARAFREGLAALENRSRD